MRIGLVLASTPGYSETFFRSKIKGLQSAGHEVIVFAASQSNDFALCPVILSPKLHSNALLNFCAVMLKITQLLLTYPARVYNFYRLESESGRNTFRIFENLYINSHILNHQLHWLHFGFATIAIRRENVAMAIGAKMGVSLRGYDISLYSLRHPGCYKILWAKAANIHVLSNALAQNAYKHGLNKNKPLTRITPAIDINNFKRIPSSNSTHGHLKILSISRLKWVKGIDYTLQALSILKNQGVDFHFTIIGDGEEHARLVFAAYQLGIAHNVTFAGKKTHEEVKHAMEQADLYLQYSVQEGFGNAVIEAQAMGLLCFVSDAEGLPENVLHEKTGWVVPRRNPKLLAEKIIEILHRPENELYQTRNHAMERVRNEFNLEKQQASFVAFYD